MATEQTPVLVRHIRRMAAATNYERLSDQELLEHFASQQDEAAFAVLMRRHGAMVLRVGQRVLQNSHDAEDVCQAAFLVLARKAGSPCWHGSIASWLHGVAYHLALKARTAAARRRKREGKAAGRTAEDALAQITARELVAVVDQELARLAEKYRAPLVLCCLEGNTQDEAAHKLGWPLSTLKLRLSQGRDVLRRRLARRGLTLSAALSSILLGDRTASAALPLAFPSVTIHAARRLASGDAVAGFVSTSVAALMQEGLKTLILSKLKLASVLILLTGVLAGAGMLVHGVLGAQQKERMENQAQKPARGEEKSAKPKHGVEKLGVESSNGDGNLLVIKGRVLDPSGNPLAGAKLCVSYYGPGKPLAVSGPDGRFQFTLNRKLMDEGASIPGAWQFMEVTATADGYALDWQRLGARDAGDELTLQMARDDVPISGRVVDLEGRPIAGVTIQVVRLEDAPGRDLTAFIKTWSANPYDALRHNLSKSLSLSPGSSYIRTLTAGSDGRFRITGVGRERVAHVELSGPGIEHVEAYILTRPGFDGKEFREKGIQLDSGQKMTRFPALLIYGPSFDIAVGPCRPITGTVREKGTGMLLANVEIEGNEPHLRHGRVRTTTDAQGRYRLNGLPKGTEYYLTACPPEGSTALPGERRIEDTSGLQELMLDIELKRGVLLKGRLLDKVTGKPIRGNVVYYRLIDNPNRFSDGRDLYLHRFEHNHKFTDKDGTFCFAVLPGSGAILGFARDDGYLPAEVPGADLRKLRDDSSEISLMHYTQSRSFNAYALINPPAEAETVACALELTPGRMVSGTVVGPDGKPMSGVTALHLSTAGGRRAFDLLKEATFTATLPPPPAERTLLFFHEARKLAGHLVLRGSTQGPVQVKMEPYATLTGRVLDADDHPVPHASISLSRPTALRQVFDSFDFETRRDWTEFKTDDDGRFRLEGIAPGMPFDMEIHARPQKKADSIRMKPQKGIMLKAGEVKDLGDLRLARSQTKTKS